MSDTSEGHSGGVGSVSAALRAYVCKRVLSFSYLFQNMMHFYLHHPTNTLLLLQLSFSISALSVSPPSFVLGNSITALCWWNLFSVYSCKKAELLDVIVCPWNDVDAIGFTDGPECWMRVKQNGWEMGPSLSTHGEGCSCVRALKKAFHLSQWLPCASCMVVKDIVADEIQKWTTAKWHASTTKARTWQNATDVKVYC